MTDLDGRLLLPLAELRDRHMAEDTTDWIWDQLVAPGYLTRVDGRPKIAGKSTLLFALCSAIRNGQPFLGLNTRPATVAYCTEQRWGALYQKLILPFGAPPYMHLYHDEPMGLDALIPRALDEVLDLGVELVIIDTVGKWMRLREGGRFDPDVMGHQMSLLEQLAQHVAVIVADYTKKGESAPGEGTLGATEQTGRADILIEIKKPDMDTPMVRRLEITGRSDAPEVIDYHLDDNGVMNLVDPDANGAIPVSIIAALRSADRAPSGSEVARMMRRRKADVLAELHDLEGEGIAHSIGSGRYQVWALKDPGTVPHSVPDVGTATGTVPTPEYVDAETYSEPKQEEFPF